MKLKLKIKLKADVAGHEDALKRIDRLLDEARIWLKEEFAEGPGVYSDGRLPHTDGAGGWITMSYES